MTLQFLELSAALDRHDDFECEEITDRGLRCPRCCVISLRRASYMHVEIDVCQRCRGVWLDHAHLEELGFAPAIPDRARRTD